MVACIVRCEALNVGRGVEREAVDRGKNMSC